MLELKNVSKQFGGLEVLKNISLSVQEGTITGLIGPNGAGKTTLFNCINGIYHPDSGVIKFMGKTISDLQPDKICKLGIGRTFQIPQPFPKLTSLENVLVGILFGRNEHLSHTDARKVAEELLEFVGLYEKKDTPAYLLTLHELRKLEVARALGTDPKLLLLDEIMAGLNPVEVDLARKLIRRIRDELGITCFWIEHVMKAIMNEADTVIVLHHGEKIAEGTPLQISKNIEVINAYLGG